MWHLINAAQNYWTPICIKTVDIDVSVVALVAFPKHLSLMQDISIWIELGKGKNVRHFHLLGRGIP